MAEDQTEFKSWARVEVMGHQTHIGYVTTQAFGGVVLFRVDQPLIAGEEETLVHGEHREGQYLPAGSVVKRADIPAATVLIGAASIYRIIPCDEAAATKAIRSSVRPPLTVVKLGEIKWGVKVLPVGAEDEDADGQPMLDEDEEPMLDEDEDI